MNASIFKSVFARAGHALRLQVQWWRHEEVGLRNKLLFSITSLIAPVTGSVSYLGSKFSSDNKLGLLLMPEYARTVADVVKRIEKSDPSRLCVLDVGANVGQFAATATRMFRCEVVSIEPNPVCWPYLVSNGAEAENWTLQRRGLADERKVLELFFVPNKSAQGSFSQSNAALNLMSGGQVESVSVDVGPFKSHHADRDHFNLVKVDVEGFEIEALKGLVGTTFDYLLIEVNEGRDHGFTQDDLADTARESLGISLEEIWCDNEVPNSGARNVLYRTTEIS